MNKINLFKKLISHSAIIYSLLVTSVYTLGAAVNSAWIPTTKMVYGCLAFSVILSVLNLFLFSRMLIFPLRLLIHYAASALMFYLLFALWGGYLQNGGSVIIALLLYTFSYAMIGVIIGIYRYITSENENSSKKYTKKFDDSYTSQFGGK